MTPEMFQLEKRLWQEPCLGSGLGRQVPRNPRPVGGSRGTIKTIFPSREAPACGRGASLVHFSNKIWE